MIAVVDDEEKFIKYLGRKLSRLVTATDPDGARAMILEHDPKIVLMDQDLKSAEKGHQIVEWIRATSNGDRTILALTSSTQEADSIAFREAGADGLLPKGELRAAVPYLEAMESGGPAPAGLQTHLKWWTERLYPV